MVPGKGGEGEIADQHEVGQIFKDTLAMRMHETATLATAHAFCARCDGTDILQGT